LTGAWWADDMVPVTPSQPPAGDGEPVRWERLTVKKIPAWVDQFFEQTYDRAFAQRLRTTTPTTA
jgi:hypothetical protein